MVSGQARNPKVAGSNPGGGGVLGGGGTLREKTLNSKKASRLVGASWMAQLWQNFGIRVGLHGPADVLGRFGSPLV